MLRSRVLLLSGCRLLCLGAVAACEEKPPRKTVAASATSSAPPAPSAAPPAREGCTRIGALETIENDPSCAVRQVADDAMRGAMKHLSFTLTAEPSEIPAGAASVLTVTITNTSKVEVDVLFEARSRLGGPRTDWSRIAGVPSPRDATSDTPRLFFPVVTLDANERDVDAPPTIANSGGAGPPPVPLVVHLRPGGKLTHIASWWAVRIPAPAPIVKDDAGHRFVPKTTAIPLYPGEYSAVMELPLYGLSREERRVRTRIRVERPTPRDAH